MEIRQALKLRRLTSLDKVFPHRLPVRGSEQLRATVLKQERYAFQLALRLQIAHSHLYRIRWTLERQEGTTWVLADHEAPTVQVYRVDYNKAEFTSLPRMMRDDSYLDDRPGLFPDILFPYADKQEVELLLPPDSWRALWFDVESTAATKAGKYRLLLEAEPVGETYASDELVLTASEIQYFEILNAVMPEKVIWHTEWFHADCIADYYGVEVFSEDHWRAIEGQMRLAYEHEVNVIYTPLFTPPLDTAVGGERTTVQLVDIYDDDGTYRFDFDRFERWIKLAQSIGYQGFELTHLFTQWGAKSAPKIFVHEDGELRRKFFWDVSATSDEYTSFLRSFLTELLQKLDELGIREHCFFHISDEPHMEHIDTYRAALDSVKDLLAEEKRIDALSDFEFYKEGLVPIPIPANNYIEPFLEDRPDELWTYYCTGQYDSVSNRLVGLSGARSRILGAQLFKYQISGFLHWGLNFYSSPRSHYPIDPFRTLDADGGFHAGDPFLIYPGKDYQAWPSIRLKVLAEAFQDLRAMQYLEQLTDHATVVELIESLLAEPLTFSRFPETSDFLLLMRQRINEAILAHQ